MTTTLSSAVFKNLSTGELLTHAINHGEGVLSGNRALSVTTGKRTGRSPKDRYIVMDSLTAETVDWGVVNQPLATEVFHRLWKKTEIYLSGRDVYQSHYCVGACEDYFLPVEVITETAWHQLFAKHLFIETTEETFAKKPKWTVLHAVNLKTDPENDNVNSDGAVMINLSEKKVLIMGMAYAGEIKKSLFSIMNYILPEHGVLPMHCAANQGEDGDVVLFFGLSGTGKTTLSADPTRSLIGDDEHGWSQEGVFNFEGGCYAKCINLSKENEPLIYNAIQHGAIMENVVLDEKSQLPIYTDTSLTQNTRAAYPREHIVGCVESNRGKTPHAVVFLTCDLYGVLPPVSILSKEQAAYHFLSGYTALVGSTEVGGARGVLPTFSTCFGAPFFPRPAKVYAELLIQRLKETDATVYLVNTGWTGGAYGEGGKRFDIPTTRAVVSAITNQTIDETQTTTLPGFNFVIPNAIDGVDNNLLNPKNTWTDKLAFDKTLDKLMAQFAENITKYDIPAHILEAGPHHH